MVIKEDDSAVRMTSIKPTLSRKIASLLLLFNLTGVLALGGVTWLIEQRSDRDELRGAIGRQQVIVTQLRSNLASLSTPAENFRGVLDNISAFERGLLEIKHGIGS